AYTHSINSQNNQNFLFIILSHSGEEKYLKETALLAKEKKHPIISFVGAKNSTLGRLADLVFSTDSYSPFSTSVAQPQMFFGQTLITFEALICAYLNHEDSIPISPKNK
ncbi:SIS domain-containing protein, partial [Enterococcus faecalis]